MPLAIELAAARTKLLTPDQILARLEHHLDLLTAGSRDLPERQQTLRGAIGWSYDLLDDGARRLVDRLSVFRGGFDLEMAERVCGPADEVGGDVVERVGELVDQSLVRLDESHAEPRFAMLETIREYAAEMLAGRGEAETIADQHDRRRPGRGWEREGLRRARRKYRHRDADRVPPGAYSGTGRGETAV